MACLPVKRLKDRIGYKFFSRAEKKFNVIAFPADADVCIKNAILKKMKRTGMPARNVYFPIHMRRIQK
jgi:hypothetical protein